MEALIETTGGQFPAHTYLLDGTTLVAYIKVGTKEPFYFKNGIKGFDKRGRKFAKGDSKLFKKVKEQEDVREVQGSKGQTYRVNDAEGTCTCPGFTFRGSCKHLGANG
jgi:hypothetical protein